MKSKQAYYENVWAARRAMIDLVVMEHFEVSDKIGVASMIESMPSKNIPKLFETLSNLDDVKGKELLEAVYADHNCHTAPSVVVNEATWQDQRNMVLLRETDESGPSTKLDNDLARIVLYSSVPVASAALIKAMATPDGIKNINGTLSYIAMTNGVQYNKVKAFIKNATGKNLLPAWEPHLNAVRGLVNAESPAAASAVKAKWRQDIFGNFSLRKFLSTSAKVVLVTAGITALIMLCHKVFNKMNMQALNSCKGTGPEKKKCMLLFKIKACDMAIQKFEEAAPGCEKKSNPQKCKLSLQKEIWYWTKRKGKYQDELQKIGQVRVPTAFSRSND